MKRLTDYDEYGQGIPKRRTLGSLETQRTLVLGYVSKEEFEKMQKDLEAQLKIQAAILEQLLEAIRAQTLLITEVDSTEVEE